MRISDWSSDVCSSDLLARRAVRGGGAARPAGTRRRRSPQRRRDRARLGCRKGDRRACDRRHAAGSGRRDRAAPLSDRQGGVRTRSEEHTSELQSLMRISYAVFCLKKKNKTTTKTNPQTV